MTKFLRGLQKPQISPLRSPEFLSRLVALADFMRLSLMKAAHVGVTGVAKQEFGYAPVEMTNLLQIKRLLKKICHLDRSVA